MKTRAPSGTSPWQFNSVLQPYTLRDRCYWGRASRTGSSACKSRPAEPSTTTRCIKNWRQFLFQVMRPSRLPVWDPESHPLRILLCCDRPFQSWPGRGLGGLVNICNPLRVARLRHSPGKCTLTSNNKKKDFTILHFKFSRQYGEAHIFRLNLMGTAQTLACIKT